MSARAFHRIRLIPLVLCLCLLPVLSACGETSGAESTPIQEGDSYRDFTAPLADGGTITLSDYEGKVILLNFWATWCKPCVGEMPAFPRLVEKYGDQLALIAVNCGEDEETVQSFLSKNDYSFPVVLDAGGEVSALYPTDGIPYTLIIAPDGTVSHITLGADSADVMFEDYSWEIDKALE